LFTDTVLERKTTKKGYDEKVMTAKQLSKRGCVLHCEDCGERVKIGGKAVRYLRGEIEL